MNRKEEIEQAAQRYIHTEHYTDWNIRTDAFKAGAKYADNHPQSPWHSVADGDLPKDKEEDYLFVYGNGIADIIDKGFFLNENTIHLDGEFTPMLDIEDVKYWMELPQPPKGKEVKE